MAKSKKNAKFEELEKYEKIRSKKKGKNPQELDFVKAESSWSSEERDWFKARVVEVHKRYAFVSREDKVGDIDTSDVWIATISKRYLTYKRNERNFICVGDRVFCSPDRKIPTTSENEDNLPRCVIQRMAPRVSELVRMDPLNKNRRHVLASNMTKVLIVASYLKPQVKWGLIDRYLCIAENENLEPIVILNKKDVLFEEGDDQFVTDCNNRRKTYEKLGYKVFSIQANAPGFSQSEEFSELSALLNGEISTVSGHSGVGKSTLVNLFDPEIIQAVEEDSNIFYKGRHTTSFASFIKLGTGGYLIDTPGIRSFTIEELEPRDLAFGFKDIRKFMGNCKYRECKHNEEPDCAVKHAVEDKKIEKWRFNSYLGLLLGTTGREGRLREVDDEY